MIVITGAAGFIGSCLAKHLNEQGFTQLILVDDFSKKEKQANWEKINYLLTIDRAVFIQWLHNNQAHVRRLFHLGARTDTTEFDTAIFDHLNLHYSQEIWKACTQYEIPLIYASSAATYGLGEYGYDDKHEIVSHLQPLNPYGRSKNDFDIWALQQPTTPPQWYGLKFFNVYGPNEYHKGRMASVIFHAFRQIQQTGRVKLFRSHNPDYKDGEQLRDFVYVKDVVNICHFLLLKLPKSGLYNVGTGQARTFYHLAKATFTALEQPVDIQFIDTPLDIRDKYQYYTEANIKKLRKIGYHQDFYTLERGIADYVKNYLLKWIDW